MKHYLQYSALELSLDQDFIEWVRHGKKEADWKELMELSPAFNGKAGEARMLVESLDILPMSLGDDQVDNEIDKLLSRISTIHTEDAREKDRNVRKNKLLRLVIGVSTAAAILLLCLGIWPGMEERPANNYEFLTTSRKLVEHINSTDSSIRFELPDKSWIKLAPGSRFSYASGFTDSANRDVFLSGEAFFEVAKNPNKPFRVFSNDLVTRVLGTSFTIRAYDKEKDINVVVQTGKVNVYRDQSEGVLLTANQEVVYHRQDKKFTKQLKEHPVIISPKIQSRQLVFDDQPVLLVLQVLKEAYGIEINYDADLLRVCTITADLTDESIFKKLELICRAINADYEVINSEVYIYPKGCN